MSDQPIDIVLGMSALASLLCLFGLWRSGHSIYLKLVVSAIAVIPVVGPMLYMFVMDTTPPQPFEQQNRISRDSNLWGWGRYANEWHSRKKYELEKLRRAQEKLKNDQSE